MNSEDERLRLGGRALPGGAEPGPFATLVAIALGGVILAGAFMLSLVLFAGLLVVGVVVGGYLWWKTRDLRKQMRDMQAAQGVVIEGEAIREKDSGNVYDQ
ncbi:MAG: hypothetical protein WBP72_06080 [Rhodocyclaceae bacterium]|jgi:hypothetical protein